MPIRFRCAYCNQLMGIARRKSGTVVRCPRCAGEVIVPVVPHRQPANGSGRHPALEAPGDADVELFAEPPPSPGPADASPVYDLRRPGIFLNRPMLLGIGMLVLLVLGLTFLLGFLLGRATL